MAHYVASKGGVIGLTKAFARELARHGITANTIPPTIVDTPMARKGEAHGDVPRIEIMAQMVPARSGRDARRHRRRPVPICAPRRPATSRQIIGVNGGMYI